MPVLNAVKLYNASIFYRSLFTQCYLCKNHKFVFNSKQKVKLAQKFLTKEVFPDCNKKVSAEKTIRSSSLFNLSNDSKIPFRVNRLNKIFMEKITEIIAMSDIATDVAGKGLEITQVNIKNNFGSIIVNWLCTDSKNDKEVNEILVSSSSFIRQELCREQILQNVPPVVFMRDDAHRNAIEVDLLLKKADFGDDFEPSHPNMFINIPVLKKEISEEIWENVDRKASEVKSLVDESEVVDYIVPLKQDVFGVNREKIMRMVKKGCKEQRAEHRLESDSPCKPQFEQNVGKFSSHTFSRSSDIKKWTEKYKKECKKQMKRQQNLNNEISYSPDSNESSYENFDDELEIDNNFSDDVDDDDGVSYQNFYDER